MIGRWLDFVLDLRDRQRIAIALAKGGAMMAAREIRPSDPGSWEFSGFSQNGEDGILDVLRRRMIRPGNRYYLEIGAADGIENNTAWLSVAEKFAGLMVEGNPARVRRAARTVQRLNIGAEVLQSFVTRESAPSLADRALHRDPDVFSLDIDGNDFHVAQALLGDGRLRPKIIVVEYNSVFGAERSVTIPYAPAFDFARAHPTELYYGVSIAAWRTLFSRHGYRFVTVDRNGVNAFFVDPAWFDAAFLDGVAGLGWAENLYQLRKFRKTSAQQFELIASLPLHDVA